MPGQLAPELRPPTYREAAVAAEHGIHIDMDALHEREREWFQDRAARPPIRPVPRARIDNLLFTSKVIIFTLVLLAIFVLVHHYLFLK